MGKDPLEGYYQQAQRWSDDRENLLSSSRRTAWIIAGAAAVIALLEALALVLLVPLKSAVPYTLLVDRQTGFVEALKPLDQATIAPDAALTRSFLVQYVIAREGFDIDSIRDNYCKVALWSAGDEKARYEASMQATNPQSPLATLPRRALVEVQVRSVSPLNANTALVRFSTIRADTDADRQPAQSWAAVIRYGFSPMKMSEADRFDNPLGFQVLRYHRDPETLPEASPAAPPSPPVAQPQGGLAR
jgi:type IV secretion system protein VirB8